MLEDLPLGQLLERWRGDLFRAGLIPTDDPAPPEPEEVAALEQRLERSLPPSYREFLTLCDGLPVAGGFTDGLRPAGRVGWFRDLEPDWLQAWLEVAEATGIEDPDVELMQRALLVSEPGDQALLLDPGALDAETGEWACFTFSNFAPGSHAVGSFRTGLEHVYRDFLANHDVPSVSRDEAEDVVESAYRAILRGDLNARAQLQDKVRISWRAWLLAVQFDAFGAGPHGAEDLSTAAQHLWWGTFSGMTAEQALADPILVKEVVPLWVVRLVEAGQDPEFEVRRAPALVAERMRGLLAEIEAGTGPVADFSYSPLFAGHMEAARAQIAAGDLDPAWEVVRAALPSWTPRTRNHVAPLGLYYDKDLRRLLSPPPPRRPPVGIGTRGGGPIVTRVAFLEPDPPASSAPVTRLSMRKQYSDRTLAILSTPYQPES